MNLYELFFFSGTVWQNLGIWEIQIHFSILVYWMIYFIEPTKKTDSLVYSVSPSNPFMSTFYDDKYNLREIMLELWYIKLQFIEMLQ